MRKIIGAAVSCLVACSLFLTVQPAFGALDRSVVWRPDLDESGMAAVAIQFGQLSDNTTFGLYDFDESNDRMIIFPDGDGDPTSDLYFKQLGNDWTVFTLSNATLQSTPNVLSLIQNTSDLATYASEWVNLGLTNEFGFYLQDANGITDAFTITPQVLSEWPPDAYQSYLLEWGTNTSIWVNDVEPKLAETNTPPTVPIPTAMLLLSSGLVGLAGFKRKMDN